MTTEHIALAKVSNSEGVSGGVITDMGDGEILVTVDTIPEGEFVVTVKGTDKVSNSVFQRQSTTQMSVSKVKIQVCHFNFPPFTVTQLSCDDNNRCNGDHPKE